MTAPITYALVTYIQTELDIVVWDAEIPRQNTSGNAINKDAVVTPSVWPAVRAVIQEPGFNRAYQFGDAYDDTGTVKVQVWGVSRASVQTAMDSIEELLATNQSWMGISALLGGPSVNPYYIIQMLLDSYWIGQEEELRIDDSSLLYRADLSYMVQIHGAIAIY